MKLNERQVAFLRVLAANRLDRGMGAAEVFCQAFPGAPHRGRRDAGATRTLDSLERLGLADGRYSGYHATGRDWRITDKGRKTLRALDGIKPFEIVFSGGHRAVVEARTSAEARHGPWNPSFGVIFHVREIEEETCPA